MAQDRTLIVDGTNLLARSMHAMAGSKLSTNLEGEEVPTGAVNTFLNLLSKYVRQVDPTRMVVAWDGGRSEFRTRIYPQYKADRSERAEETKHTYFALAKEGLSLMGIHQVEIPFVEADDIVAAYWRTHRKLDQVYILSGDKDFLQLVDNTYLPAWTVQIRPGGNPEVWSVEEVREKFGCFPHDLPDVMALAGDKGDGVPGVRGVGYKTAVKLLDRYGWSLEALLASDEKRLQGEREIAEVSRRLVDLRGDRLDYEAVVPQGTAPAFQPTRITSVTWPLLQDWLLALQMQSIYERMRAATFWPDQLTLFGTT